MQIHDVEQGTDAWFAARCGIPTASEFKKIITSKGEPSKQLSDYAAQLAGEMFCGKPLEQLWNGNAATERGKEVEAEARANYEFRRDVEVEQVGFITAHGAGCSPDGLVNSDGGCEFKCLFGKGHVQVLAYWQRMKKCPPDYYAQVQGCLWLTDREWWDLMFYSPDLPSLIIRLERDEAFLRALRAQVQAVLVERDELVEMLRNAA